jgi:predicted DNA-binding transcriptional regulator AlpA
MGCDQVNPLDEILTEKELLELLGVKRSQLDRLRLKQHLPFCKISDRTRIYLARDVVEYIKGQRMIVNRHEKEA